MIIKRITLTVLASATLYLSSIAAGPLCHPCVSLAKNVFVIARSKNFYANLDPRDQRVPRVFLQTIEHIPSLEEWSTELWIEFGFFEKALANALKEMTHTQLVNVACLMNLAGKEGTHTHWHFIPRLAEKVILKNKKTAEQVIFEDPCYGKPYDMNSQNYRQISDSNKEIIVEQIQKHLDMSNVPGGELKKTIIKE